MQDLVLAPQPGEPDASSPVLEGEDLVTCEPLAGPR